MCQPGQAGVPRACFSEVCASVGGQMLPPRPSISNGICSSPRLVQLPPRWEAHFSTQTLLSATTPTPGIPLESQIAVLPWVSVASSCNVHFLPVSVSDCDLIGSLENPDCSIIVRQRNYQGIKGCSSCYINCPLLSLHIKDHLIETKASWL